MTTATGISNLGAMSQFVGEFEVTSRLTDKTYRCRFSHLWNGVATRHSDTVDTKFLVDGKGSIVGLAHPGIVEFTAKSGRNLSDREASYVAAHTCGSDWSRKMSARFTMSPPRMWCALSGNWESAENES